MKNLFKILFLSLFMFSCGENLVEEVRERYDDGKLKLVEYYKKVGDNQQLVKRINYYENGNISQETNHKDGYLDGRYVIYYENGNIEREGMLKGGEEYGEWKYYYENGNIQREGMFKGGEEYGEWIYYDDEGKIVEHGVWENDKEYVTGYYDSGEIKFKGKRDGFHRQVGLWSWYRENGIIKNQGYWTFCTTNDTMFIKIGSWNRFDEEGKLVKTEIYSDCNGEECPCPNDVYGNLLEIIEH